MRSRNKTDSATVSEWINKNDKGRITLIFSKLLLGAIGIGVCAIIWLGANTIIAEAPGVRWVGLLIGLVGCVIILDAWMNGGDMYFSIYNREPWWSIRRVLAHLK